MGWKISGNFFGVEPGEGGVQGGEGMDLSWIQCYRVHLPKQLFFPRELNCMENKLNNRNLWATP